MDKYGKRSNFVKKIQNVDICSLVLPKFKVTISPPSYIVATQKIVSGSVSAECVNVKLCLHGPSVIPAPFRYTYGKPVKGSAVLNFYLPNQYYSNMYKDDDFQFPTYSVSLPNVLQQNPCS